jgi:hypothetical protein
MLLEIRAARLDMAVDCRDGQIVQLGIGVAVGQGVGDQIGSALYMANRFNEWIASRFTSLPQRPARTGPDFPSIPALAEQISSAGLFGACAGDPQQCALISIYIHCVNTIV